MKAAFVPPSDPVLTVKVKAVTPQEIPSKETEDAIQKMLTVAYGEQKERSKSVMVGLAAPQIGISKQIILVDAAANGRGKVGDLRVYINPEILWRSEEENEWYEGCYSTDRVCGVVSRPTKIRLNALTREGRNIEEEYTGYTARIFQHEIDHLNGVVFPSLITDDEKLHWVQENEFPQYRDHEAWRNWPRKCPREKWESLRSMNHEL